MCTKGRTRPKHCGQCRAALSLYLTLAWLTLAGFDLLEDLRARQQLKIHASAATQAREPERFRPVVNNIVESASEPGCRTNALLQAFQPELSREAPALRCRGSRLHKLNRVFLI